MAHAAGKGFTISEVWPHKSTLLVGFEGHGDPTPAITARDSFSFWAPLDQQFARFMVQLANYKHADYISFFGRGYFSTYLDLAAAPCVPAFPVTSRADLGCAQEISRAQIQNVSRILQTSPTRLSAVGQEYQRDIARVPPK